MTHPLFPADDRPEPPLPTDATGDGATGEETRLIAFLRQHQTPIPAPSSTLENTIMQSVLRSPLATGTQQQRHWRRVRWLVPSALAASLCIAWAGYQWIIPPRPSLAELTKLESFLEANWQGVVEEESSEEL